jgi:exopolysaccharide biosynthesis polyprenyl glycosylphosphotransferase
LDPWEVVAGDRRLARPAAAAALEACGLRRKAMSVVAGREAAFPSLDSLVAVDDRTLEILERRRSTGRPIRRGWLMRRMLLVADLAGLTCAFAAASIIVGPEPAGHFGRTNELVLFAIGLPAWIVLAKLYGLYERDEARAGHSTVEDFRGVFHLVTVGVWLFFLVAQASDLANPALQRLVVFWAIAVGLVSIARAVARAACRRGIAYLQNTVIVGAGDVGQMVARKILSHPEYGLNIVGFLDPDPKSRSEGLEHIADLGSRDRFTELVELLDIERVIVAFSSEGFEDTLELIRSVKDLDLQVDIVPRMFEVVGSNVSMHSVEGLPLLGLPPLRLSRSSRLLKRTIDVALAALGFVLLAPVFAGVALAIKMDSRGSVFFRQVRMGAADCTFRIFKFRTMVADAERHKSELAHLNMHSHNGRDPRMFKIPNDPRVTRVGAVLRRTRIDELPQLINVLRGEMSLVGPRPLILEEDQHIVTWARKRLDLKPGITGLWQVLGASDIPFEEMIKLDYLYVTNWSLSEDFRLIFRTLPSLARARRAY